MLAGQPYHIIKAANRCDAPRPRSQWHRVSSWQECVHSYLRFCPPRKRAPTVSGKIDEFSFSHRDRSETAPRRPSPASPPSSVLTSEANATALISVPFVHRMLACRAPSLLSNFEADRRGRSFRSPFLVAALGVMVRVMASRCEKRKGWRLTETFAVRATRLRKQGAVIFGENTGVP